MGDGAYLSVDDHLAPLVEAGVELYALRESVEARGLVDRVRSDVELVDYHRVVDLMMDVYHVVL
jgi:sulfur relay protein TusB/DsrH